MRGNIEGRIKALEEGTPGGYRTFDENGNVVIDSRLPALEWYQAACQLLRSRKEQAKVELRSQLARSVRAADGGRLFEVVAALAYGPMEER